MDLLGATCQNEDGTVNAWLRSLCIGERFMFLDRRDLLWGRGKVQERQIAGEEIGLSPGKA